MIKGEVVAVCTSEKKGVRKKNVGEAKLIENFGLENDAHAGVWHRQVSFLAKESIEKAQKKWGLQVSFGDFAENITTSGIDLLSLQIGDKLKVGDQIVIEITQKGKECHFGCEIMKLAGRCIFPLEGIFGRVIRGGVLKIGQEIRSEDDISDRVFTVSNQDKYQDDGSSALL